MTPNILEAMKWFAPDLKGGPKVHEFTWIDLGERGMEDYTAVNTKLVSGELPLVLHSQTPPRELPMPFEMLGVVMASRIRGKESFLVAITFHRDGNDMQIIFRHPAKKHLILTQVGDKSEAGESDLWYDGDLMPELLKAPTQKGKTEAEIVYEHSDIARRVFGMVMSVCMDKTKTASLYQPLPNPANEKRIRKGKKPMFDWKVIDVTAQHTTAESSAPTGRTHASPRRHVRRGHQRRLANGKTIWIKQMMVGRIEFGYIHHSYITQSNT